MRALFASLVLLSLGGCADYCDPAPATSGFSGQVVGTPVDLPYVTATADGRCRVLYVEATRSAEPGARSSFSA